MEFSDGGVCARVASEAGGGWGGGRGTGGLLAWQLVLELAGGSFGVHRLKTGGSCRNGAGAFGYARNCGRD